MLSQTRTQEPQHACKCSVLTSLKKNALRDKACKTSNTGRSSPPTHIHLSLSAPYLCTHIHMHTQARTYSHTHTHTRTHKVPRSSRTSPQAPYVPHGWSTHGWPHPKRNRSWSWSHACRSGGAHCPRRTQQCAAAYTSAQTYLVK